MSETEAAGPLDGVRVLDLTINVLGPMATQILGDLGAEVVKVEAPAGDPIRQMGPARSAAMGALFLNLNRNKKSVVLDLKREAARAALLRLAAGADVFVHSMRPQAAARLGIDYAAVAAASPRIVYASAGGYRRGGPNRDRPAYDDVIQGECGLAALIERANGEARYVPMPMADKLCGQALASAIGMALFRRERTGKCLEVHVPMLETMLSFNLVEHLWHGSFDEPEKGLGFPRMFAPHRRPYATADGYLCVLANTDEQWRRLLGALGRPELADDPRFARLAQRTENIGELLAEVAAELKKRPTAEWQGRIDAVDVPNGPMRDLDDIYDDAYLAETGFFRRYEHPTEGPMVTTAVAPEFSGGALDMRLPPPRLGAHTEEVLAAAGFSAVERDAIAAGQG